MDSKKGYVMMLLADDVTLGYYHPEFVNLNKLQKYRVNGADGTYVMADDVKKAIGEDRWRVLSASTTSYLFDPDDACAVDSTKKRLVIMSHLSDVQELLTMTGLARNETGADAIRKLDLVKALVMDPRQMTDELTESDIDSIMTELKKKGWTPR